MNQTKKVVSKTTKNQKNSREKNKILSPADIHAQLNEWAHAGTKESMDKLTDFIINEKDEMLREYAKLALEEAEFFYYGSDNEAERKEFMLAKMVHRQEEQIMKLLSKVDAAKLELEELELDKKVHNQVLKNKHQKKNENWEYNFCEDYRSMVKARLAELEDEIFYKSAWIEEARKMITSEKYQNIPEDVLEHTHFDCEGVSFWPDDYFDDPGEDENNRGDIGGDVGNEDCEPWEDEIQLTEPPF